MDTKVFIGLGNPGEKYEQSRHNAGFMFIDYLANQLKKLSSGQKLGLSLNKKIEALEQSFDLKGNKYLLCKPQTYMNKSGDSIQKTAQFYKLHPAEFTVCYDDLDIELGKFRIVSGYGPKVHNGLGSIQERLGNLNFTHVRIGVDSRAGDRTLPGQDYVLQNFSTDERATLEKNVFPEIFKRLELDLLA